MAKLTIDEEVSKISLFLISDSSHCINSNGDVEWLLSKMGITIKQEYPPEVAYELAAREGGAYLEQHWCPKIEDIIKRYTGDKTNRGYYLIELNNFLKEEKLI